MFILKKILNSSTTAPDVGRLQINQLYSFSCGEFVKVDDDGVLNKLASGERPTHVCCENIQPAQRDTALCYTITDEMIFSAPSEDIVRTLEVGTKLTLTESGSNGYDTVSLDSRGDGYLYLYEQGDQTGKNRVLIRFTR